MSFQCVAIIPARGGSKRIPRKNIRFFCGRPIIEYSINAALNANCFDEVMVSTDDKEIATIALAAGAKVPFFRSENSSNDYASLADVIEEVLLRYKTMGRFFDYICCLLPTAPFVTSENINKALLMLQKSDAVSVLPVVRFSYPIQRALKFENGKVEMFWPKNYAMRSQDCEPAYHDAGQFYWLRTNKFFEEKKLYASLTVPLEVQAMEVHDIDTEDDWEIAEFKFAYLKNYKGKDVDHEYKHW